MASISSIMTNNSKSGIKNICKTKEHFFEKSFSFNNKSVFLEKVSTHDTPIEEFQDCEILLYGNLYNAQEIAHELSVLGFCVVANSQEEIIVCAYKAWAEECVKRFNGDFCFILFDKVNNNVFFARDHLGQKNLYYYYKNDSFIVSTELKTFFSCDLVNAQIDKRVMASYLRLGFVPSPFSILEDVYKVMPGTYLVLEKGKLSSKTYWSPLQAYKENCHKKIQDYNQAKSELETLLKTCIKDRISANKTFGVFLSSGIDSSLMTAMAQSICDEKINSFTIGVNDAKFNEAIIAKKIAEHIGTNHCEHYISEEDLLKVIKDLPEYYDEPFGDSSMVPCTLLTAYVKNSVDMAIGGDGGDEVFGGYPHYLVLPIAQKLDFAGAILNRFLPKKLLAKFPTSVMRIVENRNKNTKTQMLMSRDLQRYGKMLKYPFNKPYYEYEQKMGVRNWQTRRMILDMQTTLPDEMIYKMEKAALSAGLDVRAPILDYRVVEFSFRLPRKFKVNKKVTKFILRDLATDYIPAEILNSPKRGFSVPIGNWMRSVLKELLLKYCDKTFLEEQDIFNYSYIQTMVQEFLDHNNKLSSLCWNYLMFQLWYDKYMRG